MQRLCTSIVGLVIFLCAFFYSSLIFSLFLGVLWLIIIFTELPRLYAINSWQFWVMVLLYPTLPIVALIYLNERFYATDRFVPLLPFIIAWTFDTGAFFVGRSFGRHKIAPTISPKKSWEGAAGGCLVLFVVLLSLYGHKYGVLFSLGGALALGIIAQAGDFFESYLKRRAGIKDIGALLPGHGGLLDRFDSVFFIAIALAIFFLFGEVEVRNIWEYL